MLFNVVQCCSKTSVDSPEFLSRGSMLFKVVQAYDLFARKHRIWGFV